MNPTYSRDVQRFTNDDVCTVRAALAEAFDAEHVAARLYDFGWGIAGALKVVVDGEQYRNAAGFFLDHPDAAVAAARRAHYLLFDSHAAFVNHFAKTAAAELAAWAERVRARATT